MKKHYAMMIGLLLPLALLLVILAWSESPVGAAPPARPLYNPGDCVVTDTIDSGAGTLRSCMNQLVSGDTITFDTSVFSTANPATITLSSPLPIIVTNAITIDGSTAGVILDGSGTPGGTDGLVIDGASDVVIKGLQILDFPITGIRLQNGASNNMIGGINGPPVGPCSGDCNLISGNGGDGISIDGSGTMSNTVSGNYIGTDASGTAAISNTYSGVGIRNGAQYNVIGGDTAGKRNLISGNGDDGVYISDSGTMHNTVSGNYIGTNINGTAATSNGNNGILIGNGAQYNVIGGDTAGKRNPISGNNWGVAIGEAGTTNNTVTGNFIGTDISGAATLGNTNAGVVFYNGSQRNTIGPDNTIAYNSTDGVLVYGSTCLRNTITRNSIHSNVGKGIELTNGGNLELSPPIITRLLPDSASGFAVSNSKVEVFSDNEDEGRVFEGSTTADGSGNFTLNKPGGFTLPHVTATATDSDGNTSEFSAAYSMTNVIVNTDTGKIYTTIQTGINEATPGQNLIVFPGTYTESIALAAGVAVYGAGADRTTLRGTVKAEGGGIGPTTVISGFRITGGGGSGGVDAQSSGGGVYVNNASPTVIHNNVEGNTATTGGGIYVGSGNPNISNNTVQNNSSTNPGGGIYLGGGSSTISNNVIQGNTSNGNGGGSTSAVETRTSPIM